MHLYLDDATVHPRVCGERARRGRHPIAAPGSSPRVRGTRNTRYDESHNGRFIPACAGNAGQYRMTRSPHDGSSPRVRGTRFAQTWQAARLRFIPACAGNALCRLRYQAGISVHPRVCGERFRNDPSELIHFGSSPRVRGTPFKPCELVLHRRFIPACAGNAPPALRGCGSVSVHPRVCGERAPDGKLSSLQYGSSPRVRGTLVLQIHPASRYRFIPACAGNAAMLMKMLTSGAVHPRVCGERQVARETTFLNTGSSPRVRGTQCSLTPPGPNARFIPACAGNATLLS